jgi:hypothetical protein
MPSQDRSRGPRKSKGRAPTRSATSESKQEWAARMQLVREGSALALRALFADQEASGHITRLPDQNEFDPEDLTPADALDSEVALEDEDDFEMDGTEWDLDRLAGPGLSADDPMALDDAGVGLDQKFELLVTNGRCQLYRPRWMRAEARDERGEEFLDEVSGRLTVLEKLATWLSDARPDFLAEPDPWHLGVTALPELEAGDPSVTEDGLQKLAKLRTTQFTRYKRHCVLVWNDASLPIEFLFGAETKAAWVANAVLQRSLRIKDPITTTSLDRVRNLSLPKDAAGKRALLGKPVHAQSFSEFIKRACLVGGESWAAVLTSYENRLITNQS